jgi:hypothetical protein
MMANGHEGKHSTVTLRGNSKGEEELAAVGVFATICHGQNPYATVLELQSWLLVVECCAMNAVASRAVSLHNVPSLAAEALYNAMEGHTLCSSSV